MLTTTSELSSGRATITLVPCDTCVNIWLLKRRRRLQRHLVTNQLLQLTAVWRSCCSRLEAADSSKQRRLGHLSAAQMCSRQTAITVSSTAACPTAHPVQNSGHHAYGFVDFRSAVHRRTPTMTTRSLRSTDAPRLCAVDTHWDSQASVLYGGSERLEWHCRFRNASSLSTFYAKLKTHFTVAYS